MSSDERPRLAAKIHVLLLEECSLSTPSVDVDSRHTSPENSEERQAAQLRKCNGSYLLDLLPILRRAFTCHLWPLPPAFYLFLKYVSVFSLPLRTGPPFM
jgi:hypothetical protein